MPNYRSRRGWWTQGRIDLLVELAWTKSARQLAGLLGTTRMAVIGKANRLGVKMQPRRDGFTDEQRHARRLAGITARERVTRFYDPEKRRARHAANRERDNARSRASYARTAGRPMQEYRPRERATQVQLTEPTPLNIGLDQLTSTTCRWPTAGSGLSICFCGHCAEGPSYCAPHHQIAYAYVNEKRR